MLSNSGINKVLLLGQITGDPITNSFLKEQGYVTITLVTNETIKRGEENIEHNEYHKIKIPERLLAQDKLHLQAGQMVFLEGKIHTTSYIDSSRIKRYDLEIFVSKIESLSMLAIPA
jgi:single-strand DNA-binding protein